MYIKRTIMAIVSLVLFICLAPSKGNQEGTDGIVGITSKPTLYIESANDTVARELSDKYYERVSVKDNADVIVTHNPEAIEGYTKTKIGFTPVVLMAGDTWVSKSSDNLKYYGENYKIFNINLAEVVNAFNSREDEYSWAGKLGFKVKGDTPIKLYIPSKESEYYKAVIDSILNSLIANGDSLVEAVEKTNAFVNDCNKEYDLKAIVKACEDVNDRMVIAPECMMSINIVPMYDDNASQTELFIQTKAGIDVNNTIKRMLSGAFLEWDIPYNIRYRASNAVDIYEFTDIASAYSNVANKVSEKEQVDYTEELQPNYWKELKIKEK